MQQQCNTYYAVLRIANMCWLNISQDNYKFERCCSLICVTWLYSAVNVSTSSWHVSHCATIREYADSPIIMANAAHTWFFIFVQQSDESNHVLYQRSKSWQASPQSSQSLRWQDTTEYQTSNLLSACIQKKDSNWLPAHIMYLRHTSCKAVCSHRAIL